jgi:hypothetical protein
MKVHLFLLGAVVALSLGALTLADAIPTANLSASPQLVGPSPSHERRSAPSPTPSSVPVTTVATTTATPTPTTSTSPSAHPCNHGFYVSQAAHAHKGGAYTSQVAQTDLGKNGDCSQSLPTPNPAAAQKGHAGGASPEPSESPEAVDSPEPAPSPEPSESPEAESTSD